MTDRIKYALTLATTLLSAGVLLSAPAPATAGEHAGAWKQRAANDFNGFKGRQALRTNPATVVGVGYVHASQVDVGAGGGDFVAIGTAKGRGVANCADQYSGSWTIYTDGILGGVYFCNDEKKNAYKAKTNPTFSIQYDYCPSASTDRWLLSFGGTLWRCLGTGQTGGHRVTAMLETTGASNVDRNIDVRFNNLRRRHQGANWVDFGAPGHHFSNLNYSVANPYNDQVDAFLTPLD